MNRTTIRSVGMAFAIVVATAAASTVLEIGIINASQAQVTPSPTNTTISPALKSKLCDPNNPKLRFVNTTESNICGLPKSIKNITTTTTTTPTPKPISPPSSSPRPITPPSEPSPPTEDIPELP